MLNLLHKNIENKYATWTPGNQKSLIQKEKEDYKTSDFCVRIE